jgi:hypothetical protein
MCCTGFYMGRDGGGGEGRGWIYSRNHAQHAHLTVNAVRCQLPLHPLCHRCSRETLYPNWLAPHMPSTVDC